MTVNKTVLNVEGMTCGHCTKSVTEALQKLTGVRAVTADLQTKRVEIEHEGADEAAMRETIEAIGFDVV